jgi:integrase
MVADRRYLTQYAKRLHAMSADSVDRRTIAVLLNDVIAERGMTAAARCRQSLSAFFAWLIREGIREHNPVIGTNNPGQHLEARDRVLTDEEIRAIWAACRDDDFGRIVRLLLLTGARRDEIGGLQWSEIDLNSGVLTIPGTRTKNHHALRLPLPQAAVDILSSAPRKGHRSFVFGGRGGAFSAWSYSSLALNARMAEKGGKPVAPWRLHDLRRTAATKMAEIGVQPHVIEATLNHRSGHKAGVAGVYNRASYEQDVKRALAIWADHVEALAEGNSPKVIAFRAT